MLKHTFNAHPERTRGQTHACTPGRSTDPAPPQQPPAPPPHLGPPAQPPAPSLQPRAAHLHQRAPPQQALPPLQRLQHLLLLLAGRRRLLLLARARVGRGDLGRAAAPVVAQDGVAPCHHDRLHAYVHDMTCVQAGMHGFVPTSFRHCVQ